MPKLATHLRVSRHKRVLLAIQALLILSIMIVSACGSGHLRPLDLRYKATDLNGYPLNPLLAAQFDVNNPQAPPALAPNIATLPCIPPDQGDVSDNDWANAWFGGDSTCTHYPVTKNIGPRNYASLFGHVNWFPVTVQGRIHWVEHSCASCDVFPDDDYNFNIETQDQALGSLGRTLNNDGKTPLVHSEFDSDQAIDPLLDNVDEDDPFWWKVFKNTVDSGDPGPLVNGLPVIAIGLYNLDCFHPCGIELHPLYIMAIQLLPVDGKVNPRADRWVVFAFNNGNQGANGAQNVGLDPALGQNYKINGFDDRYSLLLPPPPGSAGSAPVLTHQDVRISPGNNDIAEDAVPLHYFGASYLSKPGETGERLDFVLQDPSLQGDNHWIIMGDITLDWGLTIPPPPQGPSGQGR